MLEKVPSVSRREQGLRPASAPIPAPHRLSKQMLRQMFPPCWLCWSTWSCLQHLTCSRPLLGPLAFACFLLPVSAGLPKASVLGPNCPEAAKQLGCGR